MENLRDIMNLKDGSGVVDVCRAMLLLNCDDAQLVELLGLDVRCSNRAILRESLKKDKTYQQLLQLICVYNFVQEMGATKKEGLIWLLHEEISALGNKTPKQIIQDSQFEYLMGYLQMIKLGGFA